MLEAQEQAIVARSHLAFTRSQSSCENTPSNSQAAIDPGKGEYIAFPKYNKYVDDEAEEQSSSGTESSYSADSVVGDESCTSSEATSDVGSSPISKDHPIQSKEDQRKMRKKFTVIESDDEEPVSQIARTMASERSHSLIRKLQYEESSTDSSLTDMSDDSEYDTEPEENHAVS